MDMTKKTAVRSRRAPGSGKRDLKVVARFTVSEWSLVDAAAEREGLVLAAWVANAALVMANPQARHPTQASREQLDLLIEASERLRRAAVTLNQVVRTMHHLQQVRPVVEYVTVRVWEKVQALDDATLAVAGSARDGSRRQRAHR